MTGENHKQEEFLETIRDKSRRRQRAIDEHGTIWFGLGTFGMVGWSVAIPTVIGVLIGSWLDANVQTQFSWRLTLLIVGVIIGCLNAWYWVSKEMRHAQDEREQHKHD